MLMKIIPADAMIAELEKKACEFEEKVHLPLATHLREEAKLWCEWIAALKTGKWTS